MATLAEDISTYLVSKGIIAGYGIDCFSDTVPDKPDHIVVMYEGPSDPILPFMEEVHRSIQILSRDPNVDIAKETATEVFKALRSTNETLRIDFTSSRMGQVYLRQTPFKLKEDENDRAIYCFNIGITTTTD